METGTVVVPGRLKLMMVTMTSALTLFTGFVKMYWITNTVKVTVSISVTAANQDAVSRTGTLNMSPRQGRRQSGARADHMRQQ